MHYYKSSTSLIASTMPYSNLTEISEEEYNKEVGKMNKLLEEQERAQKEAQLRVLMNELYPVEE